jgi:hypothetical protein
MAERSIGSSRLLQQNLPLADIIVARMPEFGAPRIAVWASPMRGRFAREMNSSAADHR